MATKRKPTPAKRGRPPLPPDEVKRVPLNMRTTKELRERMEAAARESGRSLAQEVEYRLEKSFRDEDALYQTFEDKVTYRLMKLLAAVKGLVEHQTGKSMDRDHNTFVAVNSAIAGVLERFKPEPSRAQRARWLREGENTVAKMLKDKLESEELGADAVAALMSELSERLAASDATKPRKKG